jgi:diguanylate cyclase (GGDEF)-like protein
MEQAPPSQDAFIGVRPKPDRRQSRDTRDLVSRGFATHRFVADGDMRLRPPAFANDGPPDGIAWGSLGVVDTRPLTLTTADLDRLSAFAVDTAQQLDLAIATQLEARGPADAYMDVLEQLAATDPLTGLTNRRGCEKGVAREISRAQRGHRPLSCILLDIDHFKDVNDTLGHQAGDQVLRKLSAMLARSVRAYDIVARWGGEEFLLVLPGVDRDTARIVAERIRLGVQQLPMPSLGGVTISAGVAEFESDYDFESALRAADRRLYEAKAAGRNTVM